RERLLETAKQCIATPNQVIQVELDKFARDGSIRATLWHFVCLTDSLSNPTEIQCTGIDVTDRKIAENALKQSNKHYEYVNMATNDATYDWRIQEDDILWGNAFYRLFGF